MAASGQASLARRLSGIAALALVYATVAHLSLRLDAVSGFAALVWPPTGIALFALWRGGIGLWPAIFVGAGAVNLLAGASPLAAAGIATGNTLEAVTAVVLLRRAGFDPLLGRVRDVLLLVTCAALLSTAVSATVGVLTLWLSGPVTAATAPGTWVAWWLGDALGALKIAPLLWAWTSAAGRAPVRERPLESAILAALTVAAAASVFFDLFYGHGGAASPLNQPYLLFPLLIWAALRLRQIGALSAATLVSTIAIAGTTLDYGPFAPFGNLSESLLFLQAFMGIATLTGLFLAAAAADNLRLFREARSAIRVREDFLSIASHELRTPLTSLSLLVEHFRLALSRGEPPSPEKERVRIDRLGRQVDRLTNLVDSLLDVSRVMAGRLTIEPEELDLADVVRETVERFRELLMRAGCEAELVLPEVPCDGAWDRMRLDQMVSNLLTNAVKYGPGRPIEVRVECTGDRARLSVRDHGVGIAPRDQRRIFNQFERAEAGAGIGGLGLGLWIAARSAEAMGGHITLDSVLGEGARFTVDLPRRPPAGARGDRGSTTPVEVGDAPAEPPGTAVTTMPSSSTTPP